MPTYEYRCKSCEHGFEIVQAFTDDPLDTCPECEGSLRKVYGNVGISFKGSGFYKNDARGSSTSSASTSTSNGDASSGSSDSSSSDTSSSDTSSSDTSSSDSSSATSTPAASTAASSD